jgi:hypothetical protein
MFCSTKWDEAKSFCSPTITAVACRSVDCRIP